jgi:alkyl hydroperoxide reductase subunit AhpC
MPYLQKAYERFKKKGFTIVSIAFDSDIDRVMRFRRKKWHMPWLNAFVANDYHNSTISAFGVLHFPYPILVDSKGTIVALDETLWGEQLEQILEKYFHK